MSIMAVRSVNLSTETAEAWKAAGVTFARRGRTTDEIMRFGYDHVLNLGKSTFIPTGDYGSMLWNSGVDIEPLLRPGATRDLFGDLMPPQPTEFPADVWIKAPGAHGRGKYKKQVTHPLALPVQWDWQEHVVGQEYRLITVGIKLVQDFLRHGRNGDRTYEWVRMRDVPRTMKLMAREAAARLTGSNVVAWDFILHGDTPMLFEGNTCPGVNSETVRRIINEMEDYRANS